MHYKKRPEHGGKRQTQWPVHICSLHTTPTGQSVQGGALIRGSESLHNSFKDPEKRWSVYRGHVNFKLLFSTVTTVETLTARTVYGMDCMGA